MSHQATADTDDTAVPPVDRARTPVREIAKTLVVDVAVPFLVYLGLTLLGLSDASALAAAGGVALVQVLWTWWRKREIQALSVLVLIRFVLGVVAALVTGDARLVLGKDAVITGLIGITFLVSLATARPFVYYIRRNLSVADDDFETWWRTLPSFRLWHRRMTWMWGLGLPLNAGIQLLAIATLPIPAATLVQSIVETGSLLGLIAATQVLGRKAFADVPRTDVSRTDVPETAGPAPQADRTEPEGNAP